MYWLKLCLNFSGDATYSHASSETFQEVDENETVKNTAASKAYQKCTIPNSCRRALQWETLRKLGCWCSWTCAPLEHVSRNCKVWILYAHYEGSSPLRNCAKFVHQCWMIRKQKTSLKYRDCLFLGTIFTKRTCR